MIVKNVQKEFIQSITLKEYSPSTIRGYRRDLILFNDFLCRQYNVQLYINEITLEDLENYHQYLRDERQLKANSRNRYLASVTSMFSYAFKKGYIEKNPAAFLDMARVAEQPKITLTEEEVCELVKTICKPILQNAVWFMYKTGLRINEVRELTLEQVDFQNQVIHVNGKGNKYRTVPISRSLKQDLLHYLDHTRDSDSPFVFATAKTGRISSQYMNYELKKAGKKLGWAKRVTNHTLRRSFATNLLKKGADIVTIQHLLGHANLRTTSIYVNILPSDLRHAVELLDGGNEDHGKSNS